MTGKLTQKWCLVAMLEAIEVGYEFDKGHWPLHITLAGVHALDWHQASLRREFEDFVQNQTAFQVVANKIGYLGPPDRQTTVTFIKQSQRLSDLHEKIVMFLDNKGAIFNNPEWNLSGYIPHSSVQTHARVNTDETVNIDNLTLIDMFPREDGRRRIVILSVALK